MPIEVGLWRIDQGLTKLAASPLDLELRLEQALFQDIGMLGPDRMLIGRQVITADGKRIDLLAIDTEGDLHVIELKRDKSPRDAIAQLLDYGSWVQGLSYEAISEIFANFSPGTPFEQAFEERFGAPPPAALSVTITQSTYGSLAAHTLPGATCSAKAVFPSGNTSRAQGLSATPTAGADGNVSWSYGKTSNTKPGTGTHYVTCSLNGQQATASAPFTV